MLYFNILITISIVLCNLPKSNRLLLCTIAHMATYEILASRHLASICNKRKKKLPVHQDHVVCPAAQSEEVFSVVLAAAVGVRAGGEWRRQLWCSSAAAAAKLSRQASKLVELAESWVVRSWEAGKKTRLLSACLAMLCACALKARAETKERQDFNSKGAAGAHWSRRKPPRQRQ